MTGQGFLDSVVAAKREELAYRQQKEPLESLRRRIKQLTDQKEGRAEQWSLMRAILEGPRGPLNGGKRVQVIGEIMKAVPGRGRLVDELQRQGLPRAYTHSGITGVAVVTESKHYMGHIDHLLQTRNILDGYYPGGRPAILRRDFLFDPYHIWESRAFGADAVALLPSILSDDELRALMALAAELDLECLLEVRDEVEVRRALDAGAAMIGIENLDYGTQTSDLATTERLRPLIPGGVVVVSEHGIGERADVERMADCGVHAVVCGEELISAGDVKRKARELMV
jgi:indole-3-glycerol phosphate synthase